MFQLGKARLLSINLVGDLFSFDEQKMKSEYKALAKQWHPDNSDDSEVFEHITKLYHKGLQLLSIGSWERTNTIYFKNTNDKTIMINYQTMFDFELGKCYVCSKHVIYIIPENYHKYIKNTLDKIQNLKYVNESMKSQFSHYVPKILDHYHTKTNEIVIVLSKTEDVFPLSSVLTYYQNHIDCKHVAWILSRLHNLSCFLQYNHLTHCGINLSSCFISPQHHSIMLYGGWWYTTNNGQKIIGTSKDIYDVIPVKNKTNKIAETITDLESIKLLGRQLLGESNGRKLSLNTEIPKSVIQFLISGSSNDAFAEFNKWDKALGNAYGERKFIVMSVTSRQIYQK